MKQAPHRCLLPEYERSEIVGIGGSAPTSRNLVILYNCVTYCDALVTNVDPGVVAGTGDQFSDEVLLL